MLKIEVGSLVRTQWVKGSDQIGLVILNQGESVKLTRIPRMSQTELVARSCITEVIDDVRLHLPIEELLTHEKAWVRKLGKLLLEKEQSSSNLTNK